MVVADKYKCGGRMNIFFLAYTIEAIAQQHCDKHVVKMIVEMAQIASSVHYVLNAKTPYAGRIYRKTHQHHPCVKWAAEDASHYSFVVKLGLALAAEYKRRYAKNLAKRNTTQHKTYAVLQFLLTHPPKEIERAGAAETDENPFGFARVPPVAIAKEFEPAACATYADVVAEYRRYYVRAKRRFAKWTGDAPYWWPTPSGTPGGTPEETPEGVKAAPA